MHSGDVFIADTDNNRVLELGAGGSVWRYERLPRRKNNSCSLQPDRGAHLQLNSGGTVGGVNGLTQVHPISTSTWAAIAEVLELRLVASSEVQGDVRRSSDLEAYQLFLCQRDDRV
jgi:hypothetical protein